MESFAVQKTKIGIYCPEGNFAIDPWGSAAVSLITHAHGDHARIGSTLYYCTTDCQPILKYRLGPEAKTISKPYRERFQIGKAWISFHPAGHILGSAQIRIEIGSKVTVVSGDYKRHADPTCEPFESIPCDEFLTESTFALPIYQWPDPVDEVKKIIAWWEKNALSGTTSVLFCYSLGKAQRILALLKPLTNGHVFVHGAIAPLNAIYEQAGIELIKWQRVSEAEQVSFQTSLILAPPSAFGTTWMRRFEPYKSASASGWMTVRGNRRRNAYDRGFVVSDHADWPGLLETIQQTHASRVLVTHGNEEVLAQYLRETLGIHSEPFHLDGWNDEEED